MNQPIESSLLLSRCFTADLHKAFSRLAGDYNPMHDDAILAEDFRATAEFFRARAAAGV
jgi:acyl dehydratase